MGCEWAHITVWNAFHGLSLLHLDYFEQCVTPFTPLRCVLWFMKILYRYVTYCNMKITIEQNTWAPLFHQKWATHKKGDKEWRGIWGTCYVVSHPSNTFVARNLVTFPSSTCPLVVETMKRYNQDSIREEQVQNNYKIHLLTHHKFNIDTKNCHI